MPSFVMKSVLMLSVMFLVPFCWMSWCRVKQLKYLFLTRIYKKSIYLFFAENGNEKKIIKILQKIFK